MARIVHYGSHSMVRPNAAKKAARPVWPRADLEKLKKSELVTIAEQMGLPTKGTKAVLTDRIVAASS